MLSVSQVTLSFQGSHVQQSISEQHAQADKHHPHTCTHLIPSIKLRAALAALKGPNSKLTQNSSKMAWRQHQQFPKVPTPIWLEIQYQLGDCASSPQSFQQASKPSIASLAASRLDLLVEDLLQVKLIIGPDLMADRRQTWMPDSSLTLAGLCGRAVPTRPTLSLALVSPLDGQQMTSNFEC